MPRDGATSTRCAATGSPTTSSAARRSTTSTLAPGLLWGDDAELQRMAWTGAERSDAHGHPLWLALARILARISIGSIAWRTNVLSAVCAAVAVGVLYLVAVHITRRRAAAALDAVAF